MNVLPHDAAQHFLQPVQLHVSTHFPGLHSQPVNSHKARIPRHRHRHRLARHAYILTFDTREDVGVGVVECGLNTATTIVTQHM